MAFLSYFRMISIPKSILSVVVSMDKKFDLQSLLISNVPRFIQHIKSKGGVSDEEFHWLQCEEDSPDYPVGLFMRADEYLLYPLSEAHFQKGLFVLTLTLAIMSFFPGGVKIFGLCFSSKIENFVDYEFKLR